MKTDAAIERYDRMFLRDLGSNPRYSWKWSEDLIHVMDAVDREGKPIRETINTGILDANGREITMPGNQMKLTRRFPGIWQQWVVCALIDLNEEDGQVHGTGKAAWVPVYDKRSRPACLLENTHPTQVDTMAFVQQVQRTRARDAEEMAKWEERNAPSTVPLDENDPEQVMGSRADRAKFQEQKSRFKDKFTAFGEEPGKKGGTSFPTPENVKEVQEFSKKLNALLDPSVEVG